MKIKQCDDCLYLVFDEEIGQYLCSIALDEDEMGRFLSKKYNNCPYYHSGDEYKTVRKQN